MLLLFVGLVLFTVTRICGSLSPRGAITVAEEADRWLDTQIPALAPWRQGSVAELSNFTTFRWTRFVSEKSWGTIAAVTGEQPLVAFSAEWTWTRRRLFARTTAHHWVMALEGDAIRIFLDGAPFGTWRRTDGVLSDPAGQPIGSALRGGTVWINDLPAAWEDQWFAVTLRDTVVGAVLAQRGLKRMPLLWVDRGPAVRLADAPLTSEHERWLLALAIVELAWVRVQRAT